MWRMVSASCKSLGNMATWNKIVNPDNKTSMTCIPQKYISIKFISKHNLCYQNVNKIYIINICTSFNLYYHYIIILFKSCALFKEFEKGNRYSFWPLYGIAAILIVWNRGELLYLQHFMSVHAEIFEMEIKEKWHT